MNALKIVSYILGWAYFAAWSFSLYPQLYLNWRRKSVRGLSPDYLSYSVIGFFCYMIFTLSFYFNKEIQDEYAKRHDAVNLVRLNDVAFAVHGLMASLLLVWQTYTYHGSQRHLAPITAIVIWLTSILGLLILFSVHYGNSEWIHLMYFLSYVKLGSDTFKFLPQIWLNYKRKSTQGWSVYLILLDTMGGILSIMQLIVDAYIENDWSGISGDSVKLGLGAISIVYGLLFLVQKHIIYPQHSEEEVSPLLGSVAFFPLSLPYALLPMSMASFRSWLIFVLLKSAFSAIRTSYSRFFIYCISCLMDSVDNAWMLPDVSRGLWIGSDISSDKKEALADRLATSDVIVMWVSGGGFRFDLGDLYIPAFIHWIKKLATKDIKCTILLVPNRYIPKHPFPAAMKDLDATHHWLVKDMGIPRNKLIWGADDTGAALALDTLYYKIEAENRPSGLLLSSPYIGLDAGGKSWQDNIGLDIITAGAINRMEALYGSQDNGDDDDDDDSTPAPTTTITKRDSPLGYLDKSIELAKYLPSKILVSVGGNEVLLDDAVWLVARIRESGGSDINLLQCPGQIHLGTLLGPPVVKDRLEWNRSLDSWVDFVIGVLKR